MRKATGVRCRVECANGGVAPAILPPSGAALDPLSGAALDPPLVQHWTPPLVQHWKRPRTMPNHKLTKAIWEIEDAQRSCAKLVRTGPAQRSCATVPVLFGARWCGFSAAQWVPEFRGAVTVLSGPDPGPHPLDKSAKFDLIPEPRRAARRWDKYARIAIPRRCQSGWRPRWGLPTCPAMTGSALRPE